MKILILSFLLTFLQTQFNFNVNNEQKEENPIKWEVKVEQNNSDIATIKINAIIADGCHLYSLNSPKGGPLALEIKFNKDKSFDLLEKVTETKPYKEYDSIFEVNTLYHKKKAVFIQKIKIKDANNFKVKLNVYGQYCTTGCSLVDEDFIVNVKGYKSNNNDVLTSDTITQIIDTNTIENTDDLTLNERVDLNKEDNNSESNSNSSLFLFIIIAFLGGLGASLTPCVFPMIPMTVTFFLNSEKSRAKSITLALIYGFSIVVIYTLLGVLVAFAGGEGDIAAQISSSGLMNLIFFAIFIVFALSFFGLFEITLPSWLANRTDKEADKGGYIGAFFMALTLVIVSFSCTGPIVGAILFQGYSGEILKPILGMTGFGLAFALPFTILAIFPSWLKKLPKSGGWLNSVKVVFGFILLAMSLKFLSMTDLAWGLNLISRDIYISLWIVVFILLGLYLLGKIKFAHDSDVKEINIFRLFLAIVSFTVSVYMIPGLLGARLELLSGMLPPIQEQKFNLLNFESQNKNIKEKTIELCEEPKYKDRFSMPYGLNGYYDYNQALKCAKEKNMPILVDFTGIVCSKCKVMESNVWSDEAVLNKLKNDFIIVSLYVDDKEELPESEWIKSIYDGKIKNSIGRINKDIQLGKYKSNSTPTYFIINYNEEILSGPINSCSTDEYINFLNTGIENFKKQVIK